MDEWRKAWINEVTCDKETHSRMRIGASFYNSFFYMFESFPNNMLKGKKQLSMHLCPHVYNYIQREQSIWTCRKFLAVITAGEGSFGETEDGTFAFISFKFLQ